MKSVQKITLLTSVVVLCFGGYSFAHDCKLASEITDTSETTTYNFINKLAGVNFEGIMPQVAVAKAVENLKKYCCVSKIIDESFCKNFKDDTEQLYPQSAYLYDHLLDVAFRRLDGRADLAYGLSPDKDGEARRNLFNGFATAQVTTSKIISDAYAKYRTRKIIVIKDKDLTKFMLEYNNSTLADKYANMCPIINLLYNQLRTDKQVVIDPGYANGFHAQCLKLANLRISKEYTATQALMIKAANESIHTTTQAYTMNYFMQEKIAGLLSTMNKLRGLFSTLAQQAPASKSARK